MERPTGLDGWLQARAHLDDLAAQAETLADAGDPEARQLLWHLGPARTDIAHRIARLKAPGQLTLTDQ